MEVTGKRVLYSFNTHTTA